MNHAIRTSRYRNSIPYYSSYARSVGNTKKNNWQSVLAKKITIQSIVCILIIFFVSWLQSQTEELAVDIVSQIRLQVVEKDFPPNVIYETITSTYEECASYLQGGD